ncbi:MAG: ATP phosphoribosyltransferase [Candidatus Aenigmarchaeota archaeon]|nr:ATP phosphoribosyltransferase [Candidatus Aenigmarchaeota archaeon]
MGIVSLALPSGNLEEETYGLFAEAGLGLHRKSKRDYNPWMDDDEVKVKMFRSQEVPAAVASGRDLGITGRDRIEDWMLEFDIEDLSRTGVVELRDLRYGRVQTVLAVPTAMTDVGSFDDLLRRFPRGVRIATEYPFKVRQYIKKRTDSEPNMFLPGKEVKTGSPISIIYSWGATEAKPPEDAEAVAENIETRHTLSDNNLKEIGVIMDYSTARLIANRESLSDPGKRAKMEYIERSLMSVVTARGVYHIFLNIPTDRVADALKILPAMKQPTITEGMGGWSRIDSIVPRSDYKSIAEKLLELGAQDIIPMPIPRVTNRLYPAGNGT